MISDLFPNLRTVADDLCVIRTMHTDIVEHFQATLAMHTGSATIPAAKHRLLAQLWTRHI